VAIKVKKLLLITLLIGLALSPGLLMLCKFSLGSENKLYIAVAVEPSVVLLGPASKVNDNFTVTIKLYNATSTNVPAGVAGVEAHFYFGNILEYAVPVGFENYVGRPADGGVLNPSILYGVDPGFYDESGNKITSPPYTNAKYYKVAAASTGNPWYGTEGIIATITFKVIKKPLISEGAFKSILEISFSDLVDSNAYPIDHERRDGFFKILPSQASFNIRIMGRNYTITLESDGVISANERLDLDVSEKKIGFNVTVMDGYFNITIPKALMNAAPSDWLVYLNQTQVTESIVENATHTSIYVELGIGFYMVTIKSTWIVRWNLLLSISAPTITLGENVTLSGQVVGVEEPVNVTLQYMKENGVWTQLAIVRTNSTGHFECTPWKPPEVGKYYFKASAIIEGEEVVSDIVALTVGKTEGGKTGGGFDQWLLLAILCIVIIMIGVATLIILTKRKKK
jgi:hypothetical protein